MKLASSRFVSQLTQDTLAVVLAGGRGSRLKMLTDWRAKPAVPFGGKFRIIDFPLSNCINSGIRRICVLTQYKSHSLIRHIMRGWNSLSVELGDFVELIPAQQWVEEENWFEGTADAVYQSLDILSSHKPKYILILAGDHVYQMDYGEMLAAHVSSGASLTIACIAVPIREAHEFGVMAVDDDNRITAFNEKLDTPAPMPSDSSMALASMGIYVFSMDYLAEQLKRDVDREGSVHDFGKDIIPYAVSHKHAVFAYPFNEQVAGANAYWRDVGTVDAFFEANMEVLAMSETLDLYGPHWRIKTYQEQLPPASFVDYGQGDHGIRGNTMVSGGCVIHESTLDRSLLFSNVWVHRHCSLREVVALPDCEIGKNVRLTRVLLDNGCRVPDHTVIGENASEDAKRFHRTRQGVVVVNRQMLGQSRQYLPSGTLPANIEPPG